MKLEVRNLIKKFKDNVVINDISLEMEGGNIYGFIGRNGSGKSVLLKLLCGFYFPSSGSILLDGYDYSSNNEFPKNTRALIEKPKFLPDLSGYENLALLASVQKKIGKKEIDYWLEKLNLFEEKDKKYSKYSLGTKQKLGLVQVLMENPDLIILDEPFNGVETETVEKIRKILLEEKNKGKLIIIATHIKDDIEKLIDVNNLYEFTGGKITKFSR